MKRCADCKETKPVEHFSRQKKNKDGRYSYCKPCATRRKNASIERVRALDPEAYAVRQRGYRKTYAERHPERVRASEVQNRRWSSYRLTTAAWDSMIVSQEGRCALCEQPLVGRLAVDHDHRCCLGRKSCGRCIRGVLHTGCNVGLGMFQEDTDRLRQAIEYLERHR